MAAPINDHVRKSLDASLLAISRPLLMDKVDSKKLLLF